MLVRGGDGGAVPCRAAPGLKRRFIRGKGRAAASSEASIRLLKNTGLSGCGSWCVVTDKFTAQLLQIPH